jgi:hypothetical protein
VDMRLDPPPQRKKTLLVNLCLFSSRQKRRVSTGRISFRRDSGDASPFIEIEEMRVCRTRLLSSRQRRRGYTTRISFHRDRGDAHTQHASPFVEIEETHIDKKCLLSSRQRRR